MKKELDNGIEEIVELFNESGFEIEYSCSGLLEDHERFTKKGSGYISFLPISKEKEKELMNMSLSSHLPFCGSGEREIVTFKDGKEMVIGKDHSDKCVIHNFLSEYEKEEDFKITNQMISDMFKTRWELLTEEIRKYAGV